MNRIAKLLGVMALAVPMAAMSGLASAAEQAAAKADPAKGETLYSQGAPDRNVPACLSCHGAAGNSAAATNPKLAGQQAEYVHKQLADFKAKSRNNAIMTPYASALNDQEMKDIGAYLAKQQVKPATAKNKDTIEVGQKIYRGGIAAKGVPACAGCHGPTGAGIPAQYPRIGGQYSEYTEAQLVAFRQGTRTNNSVMSTIAAQMSDTEIKAVADYVAGVR
ncbi:cytochrome c553 [Cupriavidus metallidurans]|jgi:cytochrome c553|uniref:Cytochrome c4 n=2 Tax=Cupriavidus metallidurans TaxID=119219 RepID=Q1LI70_CUPMC|nr:MULTISPECIES: c-type cytochrome [Cupriavidus]PCH55518.1 MAG: cytochrome c4 [Burkholderiaceae bacterium]ABF10156.1 cytochrome c4 [Cupriavidus metallidurans CH34]AVA37252.1 cytochrome c4 [Cupriavidus metallidurans]KWR77101.1 cytochrome C [Cupriavidus sp. SHE]KWW39952.1 Cytochrome c4 [Cupriavidus metallidurans]